MALEDNLTASPFEQFRLWLAEAETAEVNDPNAMVLATVGADGQPAARTVLLKGFDERGFVFYTNKESRKGEDIAVNPRVSLLFYWKSLHRQVRIHGGAESVAEAEADGYYASRPRISRLGAWASEQSRPLPERRLLEQRLADAGRRFPDAIPRPPYWSGYRVVPNRFEFWQDMPFRLHDRTVYQPAGNGLWSQSKLFP